MVSTDAATGALLGLACGDALGRPVAFRSADSITDAHGRVTEMLADGTHGQPAGTVTDDTEMALCIARSLVENGAFDGQDIARRFHEWYEGGPFDVGLMTADALRQYGQGASWRDAGRTVWQHRDEGKNAGNGSVMRSAPYAVAFADDPDALERASRLSSRTTHYDPRCAYGCVVLNATIAGFLRDADAPLEAALARVEDEAPAELVEALRVVPDRVDDAQLRSTGYVVHTLQTALHDALTAESAEEAVVTAVNRGGDTDTVGAVAGAVAGARFGADALPARWLQTVDYRQDLELLARALATTDIEPPA